MTDETTVETTAEDANLETEAETESVDGQIEEEAQETEATADDSSESDGADDTAEDKPKKVNKTQKRINELTAKQRQAERERDYYKSQLQPVAPSPDELPAKPTLAGCGYDEDLLETEMAQWAVDVQTQTAQIQQRREFENQQQLQKQTVEAEFADKAAEFAETHKDFDQVARNQQLPVSNFMADGIHVVDNGPEVLYHLGKNPELAQAISGLAPALQFMEIGRLSTELKNKPVPKQKTVSDAPDPIEPVTSKSKVTKRVKDMTDSEYAAMRRRQIAARN